MLIYCIDGIITAPKRGFYAVKFRSKLAEHALGVTLAGGFFTAYLDGKQVAPMSASWEAAFGWIYQTYQPLSGRPITLEEYKKIVLQRNTDVLNGVDLNQPLNSNTTRVAI